MGYYLWLSDSTNGVSNISLRWIISYRDNYKWTYCIVLLYFDADNTNIHDFGRLLYTDLLMYTIPINLLDKNLIEMLQYQFILQSQ